MTAQREDGGFRALTQKISRARNVICAAYKEKCLRRRIAVRMRARGVHTFEEYARLLDDDAAEYDLLLDTLTINVTKCYRNPETWDALVRTYLPPLWRARGGIVRAWSAGCASGEEPYTLAIALAETARRERQEAVLERCRIDATDVDRVSLERTRVAEFGEPAFSEMPPDLVQRYFTAGPQRRPVEPLRRVVQVARHDLTRDAPLYPPYDVIVCRNVVIYFDRPTQEQLFGTFAAALGSGGLLVLGKVETLCGPAREALILEDPRERIYRKP